MTLLGKKVKIVKRVKTRRKDAEPSIVTPVVEDPPRSFVPKAPYPEKLQVPKK
jgi:hypothetical protein